MLQGENMSRLSKYLWIYILLFSLWACSPSSQPASNPQNLPETLDAQAVETLQASDAEVTVETVSEYAEMIDPQGEPVPAWNNIPVMPQATVGQAFEADRYSYKVNTTSGEAQAFYRDALGGQGWVESLSIPGSGNDGDVLVFEKENSILTITFTSMENGLLIILNLIVE
jgi:hypothetical protein